MTGIMQVMLGGASAPPPPPPPQPVFPNVGASYGGGFIGGKINISGTQYYLIVAPISVGETNVPWGPYGVATGATSDINGAANSASIAAFGSAYQAATFCENLSIGGYSDWYLPAKNELEVLYYFLKPTTDANNTSSGSNANAVSPEPVSTNYTSGSPAQTSANFIDGFRIGQTNAFSDSYYWTSTESTYIGGGYTAWGQNFGFGNQYEYLGKGGSRKVRAIRKVPV